MTIQPCVVCGNHGHEGWWDADDYGLITVECQNWRDIPEVKEKVLRAVGVRLIAKEKELSHDRQTQKLQYNR